FVGVTVTGTLLTLWPTVLRTRMELAAARRAARGLLGMLLSVLGATAGALLGSTPLGCVCLLACLGSFAWAAVVLVRVAIRSSPRSCWSCSSVRSAARFRCGCGAGPARPRRRSRR